MKLRNPFVSRKKVEADRVVANRLAESANFAHLERQAGLERELVAAKDQRDELADLLIQTGEAHATGPWRVGSVRMDPLALEARLRRVVPTITVQEGDNHLYVVYSSEPLDEADFARVKAEFQSLLDMDLT